MLVHCVSRLRQQLSEPRAALLDWKRLLEKAEDHGVLGQLVECLNDCIPSPPPGIAEALRERTRHQTLISLSLTAEMFRVLDHLDSAGIESLVTKGPVLSIRGYGEPGKRSFTDIDFVVRDRDMQRTTEAMIALAYAPSVPLRAIRAAKAPGEYVFRKPGSELLMEFHTERTFRYHPRALQINKLFERRVILTIASRTVPALSLEDELVLISVHGAKHFWERLLWIADVAALISRQPLDWDRAFAVANEVGALRILHLGLRLASDLLGAELPTQLEACVRSDPTVARLAAQIRSRLARRDLDEMGILERAAFRIRMRDSLLPGLVYLLRLSLSPTEEDWTPGKEGNRPAFIDVIGRPFRLVRKHGRPSGK